jgi:AcrR family transcriptional regulator
MRRRRDITTAPPPPETGVRARTYRLLLDRAMQMVKERGLVTVAEVAAAVGVSRATAYRYFPSRSKLVTALVEESLGPVRRFESAQTEGRERLTDLFVQTFPRFTEYEPQLRAAMQLALEHWAMEKSGRLDEEPFRRGHRSFILDRAARPLRARLGARGYDRLLAALSVVYGIEPYIVLKDIWNAKNSDVETLSRWILDALVDKALADARVRGTGRAGSGSIRARPSSPRSRSRPRA